MRRFHPLQENNKMSYFLRTNNLGYETSWFNFQPKVRSIFLVVGLSKEAFYNLGPIFKLL